MKAIVIAAALLALTACSNSTTPKANNDEIDALKARVEKLEAVVAELDKAVLNPPQGKLLNGLRRPSK